MSNICPCTLGNSIADALFNMKNAKKLKEEHPEQTASATVVSRKVDTCYSLTRSDSSWAYLVTFRMESGEEIQQHRSVLNDRDVDVVVFHPFVEPRRHAQPLHLGDELLVAHLKGDIRPCDQGGVPGGIRKDEKQIAAEEFIRQPVDRIAV